MLHFWRRMLRRIHPEDKGVIFNDPSVALQFFSEKFFSFSSVFSWVLLIVSQKLHELLPGA